MPHSTYIQPCPACSRTISFSHHDTNIIQCTCGVCLLRKEGILLVKPFHVIEHPGETIQPGTCGKWNGKSFIVLGRFRAWFSESVFNYWTILSDDGNLGYLGEGYGMYAIFQPVRIENIPNLGKFKIGDTTTLLTNTRFLLERKLSCLKWEIEGELNLPESHPDFQIFELSSAEGRHVTVFHFTENSPACFEVFHTGFKDLELTHLRAFSKNGKAFGCQKCDNLVTVQTYPYAQSCACTRCGARYRLEAHNGFKKSNSHNIAESSPDIPLGSSGKLKGITYEVIGYALKAENNEDRAEWKEYTLFNAEEGFAFLSEFQGHWIYAREKGHAPVLFLDKESHFTFDQELYRLFNAYSYDAVYVTGEFPYNMNDTGNVQVQEFISPPYMWVQEKNNKEGITWFSGQHVSLQEITDAFTFNKKVPPQTGTGMLEPKGFISFSKLREAYLAAVLILLIVHLIITATKENSILLEETYLFGNNSVNTESFSTQKFQLDKRMSNLQMEIVARLDNSWFELDATLVNAGNGTEYNIEKVVESYSGYDGGEYWSEGGNSQTAYLDGIPAGTYFWVLHGTRENRTISKTQKFYIKVTYDVSNHRNLLFGVLLLLIWPVFKFWRINRNEADRWYNSPYSPYSYED